jgi:acyl-CoA reductase-like NAD-dependent aldehyde dehydrogenase
MPSPGVIDNNPGQEIKNMNQSLALDSTSIPQEFQDVFAEQKAYYLAHRNPGYKERVTDLKALHRMLVENREALIEAVNADYGCRSRFETIISELLANQDGILDAIKHLRKWMKPQKRHLDVTQYPLAKARVIPQPLGVVGIVVPWNFPITKAVERIMWVKMFNAGQICTNVDYLLLPQGSEDSFVAEARRICNARYPDINNGEYTAVIDQRSYDRLQSTLEDARQKGARVINLFDNQEPDAARRIFPPHIVLDVTDDMEIMQREVFGPLLPVKTYGDRQEIIDYIDSHHRPLAFYVYTNDKALAQWYIDHTMSGGVTVNDGLLHANQHSLPFGGVGNSGMGHYHGYEGFTTFSKMRPVFYQGPIRAMDMLMPPYAGKADKVLNFMLKMKS